MIWSFFRKTKWERVPSKSIEDDESLQGFITRKPEYRNDISKSKSRFLVPILALSNTVTLGLLLYTYFHLKTPTGMNAALKATSFFSPVLNRVEIPMHTVMMNGTVFPPVDLSISRQEPGPELDAIWEVNEKIRTFVITREDVINLGKDPDTIVRFDDEYWGFGDDAYPAQLDAFHQIHCLNLIRKSLFEDYHGPSNVTHDYMYWIHLQHCVDIILQNIKCHATTDLLTLNWMELRPIPWIDFNVNHQCRDWDALLQWSYDAAVDQDKFDNMPKPKDAYLWPAPWVRYESELGRKLHSGVKEGLHPVVDEYPKPGHFQNEHHQEHPQKGNHENGYQAPGHLQNEHQ